MTQISIEQILELDKLRTQGEWQFSLCNRHVGNCLFTETKRRVKTTKREIAHICFEQDKDIADANAAYIAATPSMVAHIRELLEENKRMKEVLLAIQTNKYCCCSDELVQAIMQTLKTPTKG